MDNIILLPGLSGQLKLLQKSIDLRNKKILVMGSASEEIAAAINKENNEVEIIVEDYDSFMNSRLILDDVTNIQVKMMNFGTTDYDNDQFDLIYCQGSISNSRKKGIVKEIKRIMKSTGVLCAGEIVKLNEEVPQFVNDIFDNSDLEPLTISEVKDFYGSRDFKIIGEADLSGTLKEYYSTNAERLESARENLNDNEKSYYKKLLNQISHESNAYLNQGADKHIGFYALILKGK